MAQAKRKGMISASCLILIVICLATTLSLGKGLSVAVKASFNDLNEISGQLAFEENMIRLSQGKSFKPWQKKSYQVIVTETKEGMLLQLLDGASIQEEIWIEKEAL